MAHQHLEITSRGGIYTIEIGKYYKSNFFFFLFESQHAPVFSHPLKRVRGSLSLGSPSTLASL